MAIEVIERGLKTLPSNTDCKCTNCGKYCSSDDYSVFEYKDGKTTKRFECILCGCRWEFIPDDEKND